MQGSIENAASSFSKFSLRSFTAHVFNHSTFIKSSRSISQIVWCAEGKLALVVKRTVRSLKTAFSAVSRVVHYHLRQEADLSY